MKKILFPLTLVLIFIIRFSYSTLALACSKASPAYPVKKVSYNLGRLFYQKSQHFDVGDRIAVGFGGGGSSIYDIVTTNCTSSDYAAYTLYGGIPVPGFPNVYKTNVDGIGIRIKPGSRTQNSYYSTPASAYYLPAGVDISEEIIGAMTWDVELIKTAPIVGSGDLGSFKIALYISGVGDILTVTISGGSISAVACSIEQDNIQVPMENILAGNLKSVGSTAMPKDFNINLNCDAGARVNAKLIGVQNSDSAANGVLQLTNAGSTGVAKGVGIQLLSDGKPMEINKNIILKKSLGGQETFPFTAQYYQTKPTVTAGAANTTATLEMTYQ